MSDHHWLTKQDESVGIKSGASPIAAAAKAMGKLAMSKILGRQQQPVQQAAAPQQQPPQPGSEPTQPTAAAAA